MDYITREVTKEFHLELEEGKQLFSEIKEVLNNTVGGIMLIPLKLNNITLGKIASEKQKKEMRDKGILITHVSKDIKNPCVKEGDIVVFTDHTAIEFDLKKSINIKGVFPTKREYIFLNVNYFALLNIIERPSVEIVKEKVQKDIK